MSADDAERFSVYASQFDILVAVKQRLDDFGTQRNPVTSTVLTE